MKKIITCLQNRTNNALERYNWSLNDKFILPNLYLREFVAMLKEESRNQVARFNNIRHGKTRAPYYEDSNIDNIPYYNNVFIS